MIELSQEMINALEVFRAEWGEAEYEYYAIPVTYRSGKRGQRGQHWRPLTGIEKYACSREEYESRKDQSEASAVRIFRGESKESYVDYQQRVKRAGWREKLIEYLQADES